MVTGQLEGVFTFRRTPSLRPFRKTSAGIAESWDLSSDGKTYTFHLRANAKWSNGDPVTANDFVQILERVPAPKYRAGICLPVLPHQKCSTHFNEER